MDLTAADSSPPHTCTGPHFERCFHLWETKNFVMPDGAVTTDGCEICDKYDLGDVIDEMLFEESFVDKGHRTCVSADLLSDLKSGEDFLEHCQYTDRPPADLQRKVNVPFNAPDLGSGVHSMQVERDPESKGT